MISGYMFTRIRNMPYVGGGGWIAAGFQSQYGQEVHVVAFICMFRHSFASRVFVDTLLQMVSSPSRSSCLSSLCPTRARRVVNVRRYTFGQLS